METSTRYIERKIMLLIGKFFSTVNKIYYVVVVTIFFYQDTRFFFFFLGYIVLLWVINPYLFEIRESFLLTA